METLNTRVKTGVVRFSYPHLFEKWAFDDTKVPKYMLTLIIRKDDEETLKPIADAYKSACELGVQKFGKKFKPSALVRPQGSNYGLLIDCDADPEKKDDENYQGCYLMPLKSTTKPAVMALETGRRELDKEEGEQVVYPGCYGKVTLSVYPYSNAGTGISASVNNVLKTKDGENFSGQVKAELDFAEELENLSDDDLFDLI